MIEHDFVVLDEPVVHLRRRMVGGNGMKPFAVDVPDFYDRECRRCGALLLRGADPATRSDDWRDCDRMVVRQVMTR